MAISGVTGAASLGGLAGAGSAEAADARDYYELRTYQIETEEQKKAISDFMGDAAIPALNRIGIRPVGVFEPPDDIGPIQVLLRHRSVESVAVATQKLLADDEFLAKGASFLDAPASTPAYARVESSLMVAFTGMPHLETPAKSEDRVFQLRTYESPSIKTGQKKIEMFNEGELDIFRKTGLTAVFFGETLIGGKMPNLTYMLGFESTKEQKAAWRRFRVDPGWKKLSAIPEYANERILCGITNLSLKPVSCSQI
jgi:hypothetical protein